jgi:hypothetical protein
MTGKKRPTPVPAAAPTARSAAPAGEEQWKDF